MSVNQKYERTLVTAALPYANGYIHFGHVAGAYLPSDIYVRYKRLKGDDVIFVCGSDENGTTIEMAAFKENVTPKEIIDKYHFSNKKSFEDLQISFDIYSRTSLDIHTKTAQDFFLNLYNKGILYPKTEKQLFSEKENRFLADRFVEGTCPVCGYEEARGDQCENCGSNLSPLELINPKSKISGDIPVVRESTHLYFPLSKYQKKLEEWLDIKTNWKPNVLNYCRGWFKTGLKDRAVTRDLEWGVSVPVEEYKNKKIYVWIEAPVGYISATKELFEQKNDKDGWKKYWCSDSAKLIHFLGKDNVIFHSIIFPAMLMAHGDFVLPAEIPANEFMNLGGLKQSKSRGHQITVKDYVNRFNVDSIRYAIAANLPENRDTDFTWKDFQNKNNNELSAIFGNFVNRTLVFAVKNFNSVVPACEAESRVDTEIMDKMKNYSVMVSGFYDNFKFKDALNETMNAVRDANKYFNDTAPWIALKSDPERCKCIINTCIRLSVSLAILFSPVLPLTADKIFKMLNLETKDYKWNDIGKLLVSPGAKINQPEILFTKIEDTEIANLNSSLGDGGN